MNPLNAAEQSDQAAPGSQPHFGKYRVIRELGSGGMAQVFEGLHPELGFRVALKVLSRTIAPHAQASARFLREARAAAQIRHPNVVRVLDIGTAQGDTPFIVMEFLEGEDLATLLNRKGALSLSAIVALFLPIISAVTTAHAGGIIHRDLKPANIMLSSRPPHGTHPFVLDFGISKITGDDAGDTLTRSESLLGTVQYMAPELTRGAKFATAQSDQYALGVMLYECATGQRPFSGQSHYELMHAIVTAPVVPPSRLCNSLPAEFDEIVLRAMAREPAQRFPSVQALGAALLALGDSTTWALWQREVLGPARERDLWAPESPTVHDMPSMPPSISRRVERAPLRRWGVFALLAYAAVATWFLTRRNPLPAPAIASATTSAPIELVTAREPTLDEGQRSGAMAAPASPKIPEATDTTSPPPERSTISPSPEVPVATRRAPARAGVATVTATSIATPPTAPPLRGTNGALIIE